MIRVSNKANHRKGIITQWITLTITQTIKNKHIPQKERTIIEYLLKEGYFANELIGSLTYRIAQSIMRSDGKRLPNSSKVRNDHWFLDAYVGYVHRHHLFTRDTMVCTRILY